MRSIYILLIFLISACQPFFYFGTFSSQSNNYLEQAAELTNAQEYEKAIEAYQQHIDYRLSIKNRPEWENPNFYLLLIGDLYLKMDKVDSALKSYQEAETLQVEKTLVADRYRMISRWYEEKSDYKKAIEVLEKYRDRDPLLNDAILDRLAKELTAKE